MVLSPCPRSSSTLLDIHTGRSVQIHRAIVQCGFLPPVSLLIASALPVDTFGADPPPSRSDAGTQVITGIVIMVTDQMLVIKPGNGASVLMQIDKNTPRDRPIKEGETVEAHVSADGTARSVSHVASRP